MVFYVIHVLLLIYVNYTIMKIKLKTLNIEINVS